MGRTIWCDICEKQGMSTDITESSGAEQVIATISASGFTISEGVDLCRDHILDLRQTKSFADAALFLANG